MAAQVLLAPVNWLKKTGLEGDRGDASRMVGDAKSHSLSHEAQEAGTSSCMSPKRVRQPVLFFFSLYCEPKKIGKRETTKP